MPDDVLRVHERDVPVAEARESLGGFLLALRERYALTPAEYLNLLAGALQSDTALLVRGERK
jgi:hypothetical protein